MSENISVPLILAGIFTYIYHTKENYFTSSDPHHDMLGGGCQVRVVI